MDTRSKRPYSFLQSLWHLISRPVRCLAMASRFSHILASIPTSHLTSELEGTTSTELGMQGSHENRARTWRHLPCIIEDYSVSHCNTVRFSTLKSARMAILQGPYMHLSNSHTEYTFRDSSMERGPCHCLNLQMEPHSVNSLASGALGGFANLVTSKHFGSPES